MGCSIYQRAKYALKIGIWDHYTQKYPVQKLHRGGGVELLPDQNNETDFKRKWEIREVTKAENVGILDNFS